MSSRNTQRLCRLPSNSSNTDTEHNSKSRTIRVTLGRNRFKSFNRQQENSYSPCLRAKILAYLASTTRPFPLSIKNSDKPMHHQDVKDLCELLNLSGEDRWWEIDLDDAVCEKCVEENVRPPGRKCLIDNIPLLSNFTRQVHRCFYDASSIPEKSTSPYIECPHQTNFSQLMSQISLETRSRLSCLRITGNFQNPSEVASAIHNLLRLFPNILNAEVHLPLASLASIPEPDKIATHLGTLETALPKGVALTFQNLLEHSEFMLKWVQVKRKWYELIPNETEIAQLNKIRNLSDSEEKLMGIGSESINWARLNRGRRYT